MVARYFIVLLVVVCSWTAWQVRAGTSSAFSQDSALRASDSVLDYVRVLHDRAGNVIGSVHVYKAKEQDIESQDARAPSLGGDSVSLGYARGQDSLAQSYTRDAVYLDSIARYIYVYPNPTTSDNVTIKWELEVRHLLRSIKIYPSWSGHTIVIEEDLPAERQQIEVSLRGTTAGLYIVECMLQTGKRIKKKLIRR